MAEDLPRKPSPDRPAPRRPGRLALAAGVAGSYTATEYFNEPAPPEPAAEAPAPEEEEEPRFTREQADVEAPAPPAA